MALLSARPCTATHVETVTWYLAVCFGVRLSDAFRLAEGFDDCKHFFQKTFRVLICLAFLFVGGVVLCVVPDSFCLWLCVYAYAFNVQLLD